MEGTAVHAMLREVEDHLSSRYVLSASAKELFAMLGHAIPPAGEPVWQYCLNAACKLLDSLPSQELLSALLRDLVSAVISFTNHEPEAATALTRARDALLKEGVSMALRLDMQEVLSLAAANPEATKRVRAKFAPAVKALNTIEDSGIRGVLRERLRTEYERQIAESAN